MKKRILVLEFRQESNTFNPIVTQKSDFDAGRSLEGDQAFQSRMNQKSAVRGAVEVFRTAGFEEIPTVFMRAPSGGRIADDALNFILDRMTAYAQENTFDAIYASLHGATCAETVDDACGTLLEHLRKLAGDKPIAASFDLHANITEKVRQNADIICGYQTYPHTDLYETGRRAASLCVELLAGRTLTVAAIPVPMLIPPAGYTTNEGPFKELMDTAKQMVADGQLLDVSIFPVQPWLDIPEIASTIIAISKDVKTAKGCADQLAKKLFALRDDAQPELLSVDEIIDIAEANTSGKVVVLSEFADSPNGGCVGDSPIVAMRLLARGSKLRAGLFVRDPKAVEQAFATGVGGKATFSVGAGFTPGMPGPLVAEGRVCSLHDGYFRLSDGVSVGYNGPSAVVRFGNVDILLCTAPSNSGDPQIFRHFGIEPTLYDLIVVKANTSFRLPYGKMTDLIYCADTIGAGVADLTKLHWENIPKGTFPFA